MTSSTPTPVRSLTWWTIFATFVFGLLVVAPFEPSAKKKVELFTLEVTVSGPTSGFVQLFYDTGAGFSEIDSVRVLVEPSQKPVVYRFPIPSATYKLLRFDPIDHEETVTFSNFRIVDSGGNVLKTFAPEQFTPYAQVAALDRTPSGLRMVPTPGAGDPIVIVNVPEPFSLASPTNYAWSHHLRDGAIVALLLVGGIAVLSRTRRSGEWIGRTLSWAQTSPGKAVAAVAAVSVILSAYPVVFLGKSFVSPNFGTCLLYDQMPTLPGYRDTTLHEVGASDVGAIMWQHVPYSMLQRRALFEDFELPLWNRYNSSGNALLGQGQSSFGDPLHFLTVFANGRAWAWDLKYLVAKWLFACGLGLLVWCAVRQLGAAMLVSLSAPFVGFFVFRVNHPAFFSVCYAPWIAYAWLRIVQSTTWRQLAGWTTVLMLANWSELTSGTAKEATMLLFGMNLTGVLLLFCADLSPRAKFARIGAATAAGVAFLALASPLWLTFLATLAKSYTSYDAARVYQLQPGLLLTLFDEIFVRAFMEKQKVINGSLNFLLFFGVAYAAIRARALWADRVFRALLLSTALPLLLVFGVLPPQWIMRVPLMGNVAHLDNTFICVLIVQLSLVAGYGFREAFRRIGSSEGKADLGWVAVVIFGVVGLYLGTTQAVQRTSRSFLVWGQAIHSTGFVYMYLVSLVAGLALLALSLRYLASSRRRSATAIIFAVSGAMLLLWRQGWHVGDGYEDYVVNPTGRANFHAKSKALRPVLADNSGPFRVYGFNGNMFPGWTAVYGLETICGPDALMNPYYRQLSEACALDRTWDWRFVLESGNLSRQRPTYDFFGVKYYFDRRGDQGAMAKMLTPVVMADLEVYRSETAWPRAFFANRVLPYDDVKALALLIQTGPKPFAAVERRDVDSTGLSPLLSNDVTQQQLSPARAYRFTQNSTAFVVDANGPGVAVLQESFVPRDFRAEVNGKPAPVLRINHAFKGVYLPTAGTYSIRFTYWPEHMTLALCISALAALLWALACFLAPRLPSAWLDPRAQTAAHA